MESIVRAVTLCLALLISIGAVAVAQEAEPPRAGFAISVPQQNAQVSTTCISVAGTGTAGSTITWQISDGYLGGLFGKQARTTTVRPDGTWQMPVELSMDNDGKNRLKFRQGGDESSERVLNVTYVYGGGVINAGPVKIDTSCYTQKTVTGVANGLGGDDPNLATRIGLGLVEHPDVTTPLPFLAPIHGTASAMGELGLSIAIVLFLAGAFRAWAAPSVGAVEVLRRGAIVAVALGAYNQLASYAVALVNFLAFRVLNAHTPAVNLGDVLTSFASPWALLNGLALLGAIILLFVLAAMKIVAAITLAILYMAGPIAISTTMLSEVGGVYHYWWTNLLKILSWPIIWAFFLKALVVITTAAASRFLFEGVAAPVVAPIAALVVLGMMFVVPLRFALGPSPRDLKRAVSNTVHTVRTVTSLAATGGSSAPVHAVAAAAGGAQAVRRSAAPARKLTSTGPSLVNQHGRPIRTAAGGKRP